MTNTKFIETMLSSVGLRSNGISTTRVVGTSYTSYEFEVYKDQEFMFEICTDSFECAIKDVIMELRNIEDSLLNIPF